MKTGLRLRRKVRFINSYIKMFRFRLTQALFGFDAANVFLKRLNKDSVQLILQKSGANIGKNCDIESGLTLHNCKDYSNLYIGSNCHVGKNCFFDLRSKIIIENNVIVSMGTTFITHQDMSQSVLCEIYPASHDDIIVKNNSYIGANATILQGITIHEYSVVAAGAVITKDVLSYSIVAGVPAKIISNIKFMNHNKNKQAK